ncbi:MAG: biopolymer transporter ExbD [Calditrichaeota bacterium]|nr:biopolymer transporter ExbD [Calditrichota bacterium]
MAFQPSKIKKHLSREKGTLNLNSMMDMMTIILLFLLKSFSTSGAIVTPSKELHLPSSTIGVKPSKQLTVSIAKSKILVSDRKVVDNDAIPPGRMIIPELQEQLKIYADKEKELEKEVGKVFSHEIIIEGDKEVPFDLLLKVMYTCSQSEFYKMRLLTIKKNQ